MARDHRFVLVAAAATCERIPATVSADGVNLLLDGPRGIAPGGGLRIEGGWTNGSACGGAVLDVRPASSLACELVLRLDGRQTPKLSRVCSELAAALRRTVESVAPASTEDTLHVHGAS